MISLCYVVLFFFKHSDRRRMLQIVRFNGVLQTVGQCNCVLLLFVWYPTVHVQLCWPWWILQRKGVEAYYFGSKLLVAHCLPGHQWHVAHCLPCYLATTTREFQRAASQGELMNLSSTPTQPVLLGFLIVRDFFNSEHFNRVQILWVMFWSFKGNF